MDGHRVVDHGELEHLGDVAVDGVQPGHVDGIEPNSSTSRLHQAGDDIEQRRLAAAGGAEQSVGTAVRPLQIDLLERPVDVVRRIRQITVSNLLEGDSGHGPGGGSGARTPAPQGASSAPSSLK